VNEARTLERNVRARNAVNELLTWVPTVVTPEIEDRFWEVLAEYAAARCACVLTPDTPPPADAMSMEQALAFERRTIPFGIHAGERVGSVPPRYWLNITEGDFQKELRRYLQSRRFLELQAD
jgi:hypothetical protein